MKSNLTDQIVLIQSRKDKNEEHLNTDKLQDTFISKLLNYVPAFLSIYENKNKTNSTTHLRQFR